VAEGEPTELARGAATVAARAIEQARVMRAQAASMAEEAHDMRRESAAMLRRARCGRWSAPDQSVDEASRDGQT
jgi:hypothetical protein